MKRVQAQKIKLNFGFQNNLSSRPHLINEQKMKQAPKPGSYASIKTLTIVKCRATSVAEKLDDFDCAQSQLSGSSLQRSSFQLSAQKPLTNMISPHQTIE